MRTRIPLSLQSMSLDSVTEYFGLFKHKELEDWEKGDSNLGMRGLANNSHDLLKQVGERRNRLGEIRNC